MDDETAWMLQVPPLWPDSISAISFCSNAATPATACLGNSLKHEVPSIPDPSNDV